MTLLYGVEVGVWFVGVEDFVAVHDGDEVFGFRKIDDVMGIAGEHVHGLDVVAGDFPFEDLSFRVIEVSLLDEAVAFDNDELLELGVVPVLALGDAGLGDVDGDLTCIERMDQLCKRASVIHVHLEREGGFFLREVAEVGAVEFLGEAAGGDLGDGEGLGLGGELVEQVYNFAEGGFVGGGDVAVAANFVILRRNRRIQILRCAQDDRGSGNNGEAVEFAAMLLAFEAGDHFVHEVIDVEEFQLDTGVVDGIGQVVGDGVAEGGDGGVVVGTAPFAEEVRKTIDQDFGTGVFAILEEEVLPCFFAAAIFGVAEASGEAGLLRAGEHDRAGVAVLLERVEKGADEAEVAGHEFFLVLGTVDAGEVEDEVGLLAPLVELLGGGVKVVFEDGLDVDSVVAGFAVFDVVELGTKVLSNESFGAGDEDSHYLATLGMPASSFWMYSRDAILALVSSRLRRRVLLELNSSIRTRLVSPSLKNLS